MVFSPLVFILQVAAAASVPTATHKLATLGEASLSNSAGEGVEVCKRGSAIELTSSPGGDSRRERGGLCLRKGLEDLATKSPS
jgi:hypothetical protein